MCETLRELDFDCAGNHPARCPRAIYTCTGLTRLTLRGFVVVHGDRWMRSDTLRELVLDRCVVDCAQRRGRVTSWGTVCRYISKNMERLVFVDVRWSSESRYMRSVSQYRYSVVREPAPGEDDDLPALKELMETVRERRLRLGSG